MQAKIVQTKLPPHEPLQPKAHKQERNGGLDIIRAMAISLVLVTHYSKMAPVCGILGVELFFVLSGFLIGGILYRTVRHQETFSFYDLRRFWVRRWLRTLPSYYLFLGIFTLYNNTLAIHKVHWHDIWRYLIFLQNFDWPAPEFYGISWSLAVEEWFYLLFPLGFYVAYKLSGISSTRRRVIFLGSIASFFVFSMTFRFWQGNSSNWASAMRTIVVYRFDALMFGVVLAVIKEDSTILWKWMEYSWLAGVLMLAIGTFVAHTNRDVDMPILPAAWLFTIIPGAFALVFPSIMRWSHAQSCWMDGVRHISRYSYSMYLCHWPILWVIMHVVDDSAGGVGVKLLIRLAAVVSTIACSAFLYRYWEQPMLNLAPMDKYSPLG